MGLLTFLLLTPLVGSIAAGACARRSHWPRRVALVSSLGVFALSLLLWARFDPAQASHQFVESVPWIPSLGIAYLVGIDGVSLFLVLLTAFLTPLTVLASWESAREREGVYYPLLLALEALLIGVFLAIDVFLFYVFWEAVLVPMYLLIGIWGGRRRVYAATKFFLFAMGGSAFLLLGILICYHLHGVQAGTPSFDVRTWQGLVMSNELQRWLFLAFFVGFAVRVPIFPLHVWLPDAHREAPTAASVFLTGILLEIGVYGLLRFSLPLFPEGARTFASAILILAVLGVLYGALVAMVQPDLKRLAAYFSLSNLGLVVMGIFSFDVAGVEGAVYQMLSHGVSTAALFLLIGMLYERRRTYTIEDFGGLKQSMPRFAGVFSIVLLSCMGLPGLNVFVGEFLILRGTFRSARPLAIVAGVGVLLTAVYLLRTYRRVWWGEIRDPANAELKDFNRREGLIVIPLLLLIVWMGVAPGSFLRTIDGTAERLIPVAPVGVLEE